MDMIRMQKEDSNFVGDFGLVVLAKLCVSATNSPSSSSGNLQYTSNAVIDYLEWAKREEATVFGLESPYWQTRCAGAFDNWEVDLAVRVYTVHEAAHRDLKKPLTDKDKEDWFKLQEEMVQGWASTSTNYAEVHNFFESFSDQEKSNWSVSSFHGVIPFYVRAKMPLLALHHYNLMKNTPAAIKALDHQELTITTANTNECYVHKRHHQTYNTLQALFNQVLHSFACSSRVKESFSLYNSDTAPPYNFKLTYETCSVLIASYALSHPIEGNRFLNDFELFQSPWIHQQRMIQLHDLSLPQLLQLPQPLQSFHHKPES
ncbi:UNVERIFIED_CONTAM: hypothetical protein HDU68_010895 [Siphonaria sp. JEL0065]|nr:hypothetical protein HDU68_010895 [Siphonaria sp. JEL0065]